MRIINRAEFLKMPKGTIYKAWEPDCYGELCIKGDTLPGGTGDWHELGLVQHSAATITGQELDHTPDNGDTYRPEYLWGREGLFEIDALFCVYEIQDINELIQLLTKARYEVAAATAFPPKWEIPSIERP